MFITIGFHFALIAGRLAGLLAASARTVFPILIHLILEPSFSDLTRWLSRRPYFLITDFLIGLAFYSFVLAFGEARNYYHRL